MPFTRRMVAILNRRYFIDRLVMQSIISMQIKLISLGAIIQDIRNAALKQNEHKEK